MLRFTALMIAVLAFAAPCSAEIITTADRFGNSTLKSVSVFPHSSDFDIQVHFSGGREKIKGNTYAPNFILMVVMMRKDFSVIKPPDYWEKFYFFPTFFYYVPGMAGSKNALISSKHNGEVDAYNTNDWQITVDAERDTAEMRRKITRTYDILPMVTIGYNGRNPFAALGTVPNHSYSDPSSPKGLCLDSPNDADFGAAVLDAVAKKKELKIVVPYMDKEPPYTATDYKNPKYIVVTVSPAILAEWQIVSGFTGAELLNRKRSGSSMEDYLATIAKRTQK